MLTKEEIKEKIIAIISEYLEVDAAEVTDNKSFIKDLGADSLDTAELLMAIEDALGVEIPDEDAEKLTTLQSVVDYIAAQQ